MTRPRGLATTYLLSDVAAFLDSVTDRMLADGIVLQDVRHVRAQAAEWADWLPAWLERADVHERHAVDALAKGAGLTAASHFIRASLCAHYAQFMAFHDPSAKDAAAARKVALYHRAAPLLAPPADAIEIPFVGGSLPGYLRLPPGSGPAACAVLVGGLDAAKEDAQQFSDLCLARGIATLAFDGPGQGEAYLRGRRFGPGFAQAISAAIDALEGDQRIAARRIGLVGRSLGGYLAADGAARDPRVAACVVWSALWDMRSFERKPPLIKDGYQAMTGTRSWDEARSAVSFVDLRAKAQSIQCPLYILHGGRDNSTPVAGARALATAAGGPVELVVYPEGIHCNHDLAHVVRPAMADWLAARLGGRDT